MTITKDILIEELVENHPETVQPLQEMGVRCVRCGEPVWGTLEENVRQKGLKNLDEIVLHLNSIIGKAS